MVLARVSEGGRRRPGLSWPNFSLEDILALLPSPISFPHFPEDMVFPYCLWGPQNPSVSRLHPEFLLLLPSLQPALCFLAPAVFLMHSAADFPSQLICEHAHGPGLSSKEPTCQRRRHRRLGFDPWVGKIPWRRAWRPTSVFLPGESHGQPGGLQSIGSKESDTTEAT